MTIAGSQMRSSPEGSQKRSASISGSPGPARLTASLRICMTPLNLQACHALGKACGKPASGAASSRGLPMLRAPPVLGKRLRSRSLSKRSAPSSRPVLTCFLLGDQSYPKTCRTIRITGSPPNSSIVFLERTRHGGTRRASAPFLKTSSCV